ncbi:15155_t:CDS:2, partial [Acaulospora colombiana]
DAVPTEEQKTETQEEEPCHKVFVGNLAFQTGEQQLFDFFNKTVNLVLMKGNKEFK